MKVRYAEIVSNNPLFEAYRLIAASPRTDRLEQVLTALRVELEADGALIYQDPATGELELVEALRAPDIRTEPRRATRAAVLAFRRTLTS